MSEKSVDEDCPRSLRSTFDEDVVPMFIVTMTVRHGFLGRPGGTVYDQTATLVYRYYLGLYTLRILYHAFGTVHLHPIFHNHILDLDSLALFWRFLLVRAASA